MKNLLYLPLVSLFFLGVSCGQSTNKQDKKIDRASSEVAEVADGLTACKHASKIYWKGAKPNGEHNGIIKLLDGGNFIVDDGKLVGGKFIISMGSIICIDIENEEMNTKLVNHLKSEDFFHVDSFPTAEFNISTVEAISSGEYNSLIKGSLTMKGITHAVEFKAKVNVKNGMVSAKSEEFLLDRTKWKVQYMSKSVFKDLKDKFINDEFSIMIDAYSM